MRKKRQLGKKGQVTVFIIIGIVILGIVLGMVYVSQYLVKEELKVIEEEAGELSMTTSSVKMFVENCLEKVGEEGIFYLGWQGGYYHADYRYVDFSSVLVPYFYYLDNYYLPDKEVIAEELSSYIEDNLDKCINNFEVYKERGAIISEDNLVVKSEIVPGKILIEAEYPIKIKRAEAAIALDRFLAEVELDFNEIYDQVSLSLEEQKEAPNTIPLGGITHLAYLNDFNFEVDNLVNDTVLYLFLFDNIIQEEPYVFIYAAKYDWSEEFEEKEEIIPPTEEESLAGQEEILVEHYKEQGIDLFVGIAEEEIIIPEETDYNSLSTEDLVAALANGEVADLTVIKDDNFIPALNNNLALLGREEVLNDFNRRIGEEISLINKNIQIKKRWFMEYEITDQGVELAWYVGGIIETEGDDVTEFKVDKHPGAIVEEEGGLILPEGAKVGGCAIIKEGDIIEIEKIDPAGRLDLKGLIETAKGKYQVSGGIDIWFGKDKLLTSGGETSVIIKNGIPTFIGEAVLVKKIWKDKRGILQDRPINFFTGTVTYHGENHLTLSKGTNFRDYSYYTTGVNFEVSKDTQYHTAKGGCGVLVFESCIEYIPKGRALTISAVDDSKIKVTLATTIGRAIKKLEIKEITDGSVIEVNDNQKVGYVFSKGPVKIRGQPMLQSIRRIEYSFSREGEPPHIQKISKGWVMECSSPCKKSGKLRVEPDAINRNKEEILAFLEMLGQTSVNDPGYIGGWGGLGPEVRKSDHYEFGDRQAVLAKDFYKFLIDTEKITPEDAKKFVDRRVTAVFSCIGLVQTHLNLAMGDGFKGKYASVKYTHGHRLHKALRNDIPGLKTEFHVIKGVTIIPPEIQREIFKHTIREVLYNSADERAEAMKVISGGAPMAVYYDGVEGHAFLKAEAGTTATIDAHVMGLSLTREEGALAGYGDRSGLLVSY